MDKIKSNFVEREKKNTLFNFNHTIDLTQKVRERESQSFVNTKK